MQEALSSVSPYNYEQDTKTKKYSFTTDMGREYFLFFYDASKYFPDFPEFEGYIKEFGFGPLKEAERRKVIDENGKQRWEQLEDPRIRATVMTILKKYLEEHIYLSLIYVCSREKEMDRSRNILFNKWFNEARSEPNYFPTIPISKHQNSIRVNIHDKQLTYATLLAPETCPYKKRIEEAFLDYQKSLIKRPFYYEQK